jgi:hypothetical protein
VFEGKTLFNYYLLVRLLQRKQVVLFSPDGKVVYLFYFTGVFKASVEGLAVGMGDSLPHPISSSNAFIWSLFEIRDWKEPELFLVHRPCFPVQVVSPDPTQYKTWRKESRPLMTGLPLWTRDELAKAYVLPITHFCLCLSIHSSGCNTSLSTSPC